MSLLDDVSIVVTPNGYKAGELYAVIPSNGDADMDVTRATAATRVDENGLVNYAEIIGGEELQDGDFELTGTQAESITGTYWTTGSKWIISNNSAYTDATSYSNLHQNSVFEVGKTYTLSIEVSGGNCRVYLGTSATSFYVLTNGLNTITAVSEGDKLTFRPYTTPTTISNISVKEVTRDNVPRIDYTGGGCPHILAEPQRTNLLTYSEDFSSWTTTSATLTPNQLSPDGTNNAYIIEDDDASGYERVDVTITTTATPCTLSVFVKKKTSSVSAYSGIQMGTGFSYLIFDSYNGTYNQSSNTNYDSIEVENFNSDWWRLKLTATVTTSTRVALWGAISSNGTTISPSATGSETFWGAQLEEGSYATSYIPTSGSTVTRNQDIFSRDGIGSLINSTEGVLFVEMAALADDGVAKYITMNDGSSNNDVRIYFNTASNGISALLKSTTGATQAFLSYTVTDTTAFHKIAFVYAVNRFELWVDGEKRAEDLSGIAPVGLTTLEFSRASNFLPLFAKVKQLQVYDTALTDDQLEDLTS